MSDQYRVEVQQNSSEWNQITTQLQFTTAKPSIKVINLFKYNIAMQRSSKDTSIDAFINITDLNSQFKQKAVQKTIPLQDLIFICGHFSIEKYKLQTSKVFHLLLCELALGKIGLFSDGLSQADSLLIQPDNPSEPYHYNVLIKNQAQYLVKYEIAFVLQNDNAVKQIPLMCSLCSFRAADLYCIDERKHYCEHCSSYVHPTPDPKKTKLVPPQHELQPITRTNSLPLCELHTQRHEFYCLGCEKYICPQCAKQPLHNNNEYHTVRPIEYLYSQKHQSNTRVRHKPRQKLKKLLAAAQQKMKQITNNYEQVKSRLQKLIKKALQQLQFMYRQRSLQIQNDLIQLEFQLQKITWFSQFVKKQEEGLKPLHYFKIQARYEYEMKQIQMNRFGSSLGVLPDLDFYCVVEVGTTEEIVAYKQNSQAKRNDYASDSPTPSKTIQNQSPSNKGQSHQNKNLVKLLSFNPNCQPVQLGELSLQLESSGIGFFKIRNQSK